MTSLSDADNAGWVDTQNGVADAGRLAYIQVSRGGREVEGYIYRGILQSLAKIELLSSITIFGHAGQRDVAYA